MPWGPSPAPGDHASNTIDRVLAALEKRGRGARTDRLPANGRPADEGNQGCTAQSVQ